MLAFLAVRLGALIDLMSTLLEGVGGGEPYSKPNQQVEEAEVTGARFSELTTAPPWCCEKSDL